jgi:type III secretion system YseE family protein
MAKKSLELSPLQERLRADKDGTYAREVTGKLRASSEKLRQAIAAGVPPPEFKKLTKLKKAVDEAIKVIETVARR